MRGPPPRYVAVLDPLRGLAALAVAIFHFTNNGWLPADHWLAQLAFGCHHGVKTFFVISGFVVPSAMWFGGYSMKNCTPFLARRLTRLYPPYCASVVLIALTRWAMPMPGAHAFSAFEYASHLLFLNELLDRPWLMDIYWTLALEVQFYLLAALAWPLLASRKTWHFACAAALALALGVVWNRDHSLPRSLAYFLLGLTLFRQHAGLDRPHASLAFLGSFFSAIFVQDGGISLLAAVLPVAAKFGVQTVSAPAQSLGKLSYSFYLFHLLSGAPFLTLLAPHLRAPDSRCWMILPALLLSLAAALAAYRLIEEPAIRWSKSFPYHSAPLITSPPPR